MPITITKQQTIVKGLPSIYMPVNSVRYFGNTTDRRPSEASNLYRRQTNIRRYHSQPHTSLTIQTRNIVELFLEKFKNIINKLYSLVMNLITNICVYKKKVYIKLSISAIINYILKIKYI